VNYRELKKKLLATGCYEIARRGGGSHRKWFNPAAVKGATIPDWGKKDLKVGTISAVLKQLGIANKNV